MSDLTTLANVKAWIPNYAGTTDDVLLTRLISAVSEYIQTWLNRSLASQSYTEFRDGHGGTRLMFADYPVTAVASVSVDGATIPAAQSVTGTGYRFNATSLMLSGYLFSRGMGNVAIAYTAGFTSTPNEIEQACIELVAMRYKERERIGIVSKGMAGESITFSQKDFSDSVLTILKNYKKVVLL
jgi:hypothetical protein